MKADAAPSAAAGQAGRARANIRIGVSGWTYPPWRGNFYPEGLRQKDELAFAARAFSALEINGTFYGMQIPSSFQGWAAATPARKTSASRPTCCWAWRPWPSRW